MKRIRIAKMAVPPVAIRAIAKTAINQSNRSSHALGASPKLWNQRHPAFPRGLVPSGWLDVMPCHKPALHDGMMLQ